jgi:hypothetical protein
MQSLYHGTSFALWYKCLDCGANRTVIQMFGLWCKICTVVQLFGLWRKVCTVYQSFGLLEEMFGARMRRGWLYCCIGGGDDMTVGWHHGEMVQAVSLQGRRTWNRNQSRNRIYTRSSRGSGVASTSPISRSWTPHSTMAVTVRSTILG